MSIETPPEKRLICAVIINCLVDVSNDIKGLGEDKAMRQEAAQWILSKDTRIFGFEWCCSVIDFSPHWIRDKIRDADIIKKARDILLKKNKPLLGDC